MKKHSFIAILSSTITVATLFTLSSSTTAHARYRAVSIPSSLRGTWYNYDSSTGTYDKVKMTKYHFKNGSVNLSGVKYPKYAMGHPQMFVYKSKKGYYTIGAYASDEWPRWKKVTHKKHTALRVLVYGGPVDYVYYYYKTKTIAKHPTESGKIYKSNFKVAKHTEFSSSYRTGYLDNVSKNYKFYKYDSDLKGPGTKLAFKIKNSLTPLKVKKSSVDGDGNKTLEIIYKGTHAIEEDFSDYHTVYPYNTGKVNKTTVSSATTPYSGKAVLKHGIKPSKIKTWMVHKSGNKFAIYKHVKGGWQYTKTV